MNGSSNIVSAGYAEFSAPNYQVLNTILTGFADLPAGTYTIRARVVRQGTGNGNTRSAPGNASPYGTVAGCNDIPRVLNQMIIQIFPK